MHTTIVTPQLSDIDAFRHVNFQVIHRWFESGRLPMYRLFVPDLNPNKLRLVMVRLEVDYLAEIFLGTDVEIRTWVAQIGNSSFRVQQEAYQNGRLCAQGTVVLVHFDNAQKKSVPLDEELREQLTTLLRESP